jgi:hypothetical protein
MSNGHNRELVERQMRSPHLTAGELEDFATPGSMTDAARIHALTHAAGCDTCRSRIAGLLRTAETPPERIPRTSLAHGRSDRVATAPRTGRQIVALSSPPIEEDVFGGAAAGGRHLTYEEIAGLVSGALSPVERDLAEGHLDTCEACRAEVADQRLFLEAIRDPVIPLPDTVEDAEVAPDSILQGLVDRLGGAALREVRAWYRRQQEAFHHFLPAAGALTAAAAGNEAAEAGAEDTRLVEVWERRDETAGSPAILASGLVLRLTRRGGRYRARAEYIAPEGDPRRARYANLVVRLVILDAAGEPIFASPREITVGGSLLLGELQLTEGATILATVIVPAAPDE